MITFVIVALVLWNIGVTVIVIAQGEHLKGHDRVLNEMRNHLAIHDKHLRINDDRIGRVNNPTYKVDGIRRMAGPS